MNPSEAAAPDLGVILRSVVESAPIATAILDSAYRYVYVNDAYTALTRRDRAAHRGLAVTDAPPASEGILRALQGAAAGRIGEFDFSLPADRDPRHWVGIVYPLRQHANGTYFAVLMRDVTVRARAERDRQEALGIEQYSRQQAERERDFLRMVLQNAPMGISVWEGAEHRLVLLSDFAAQLVGAPRESLIGRPIAEVVPETYDLLAGAFDRVYNTGETVVVPEALYPLPNGRQVWAYSCYAPVVDRAGTPIGVMSLGLDISELKRTQKIVESQKRVLETMAEGQNLTAALEAIAGIVSEQSTSGGLAAILLLSDDGRRLVCGAAPDLPAGYTAGASGFPVAADAACAGAAAFLRARVVSPDLAADPLWARHADLAAAHGLHACWSSPIVGHANDLLGTIDVYYREPRMPPPEDLQLVDLLIPTAALAIERARTDEERQRLLEAERRARRDAEAANRSKDEFVATLSHELRTPLNAILGWARILRAGELDPEAQIRALEAIERNTRAQSQLVEDLLDISRIITGKLRLDVRSVELSTVVDGAVEAVRPAAEAKDIRLQKILDPRAAPISGDPDRLQQVVWNLLSNSIKFTPKGGRVQVRLERVNSHVEILVSDTGAGIAPDVLPRIFERFQQGEDPYAKTAGLGLGLAIARHLVELHGGTIHASSDGAGLGSTFVVKLPLMAARDDRAAGDVHPTASSAIGGALPSLPRGVRVLVVEDDEDGREIVANILGRAGADVRTASSADEGFALAEEWRPDVLISDIEMPGENGYAFLTRLRQQPGFGARELPAIALTAYARVEDRIRALAAGFQMHVPKPVEPAELIAVVKALLPDSAPSL